MIIIAIITVLIIIVMTSGSDFWPIRDWARSLRPERVRVDSSQEQGGLGDQLVVQQQ